MADDSAKFECPSCLQRIGVTRAMSGSSVQCPQCEAHIVVPQVFLLAGSQIGSFRIERLIGSGGMGDVYLATQVTMDRKVAVKILSDHVKSDPEKLEDFLREVRNTAKLDHPNIVTAFEAGEDQGYHFLAMTFVDGDNLDQIVTAEGPMDDVHALEIVLKVAGALKHAWDRYQLLHRDIKPGNIVIENRDDVRLLDLGLARTQLEEHLEQNRDVITGSPQYMSPEAIKGDAIGFHGDMYSLGGTLYFAITGRAPFAADNVMELMSCHLKEPLTSPRKHNPDVSIETARLIGKMMAKDRAERFESWPAMITAGERLLKQLKGAAGPAKRKPSQKPRSKKPKPVVSSAPKPKPKLNAPAAAGTARRETASEKPGGYMAQHIIMTIVVGAFLAHIFTGPQPVPGTDPSPPPVPPVVQPPDPAPDIDERPTGLSLRYDELKARYTTITADNLDAQLTAWRAFVERAAGTASEPDAQSEIERLMPYKIYRDLRQQATELGAEQGYQAAADMVQNYAGPYQYATGNSRKKLVESLQQRARAEKTQQAQQLRSSLNDVLAALLKQDFTTAESGLASLQADPGSARLLARAGSIQAELEAVLKLPQIITESFANDIGLSVFVEFSDGMAKVTITGAGGGQVSAKGERNGIQTPRNFGIADLAKDEKLKRLGVSEDSDRLVMRGIIAAAEGDAESAKLAFQSANTSLGNLFVQLLTK
ncbi:MAG: serine/threonine protein kinase [Rhodothermales bacterium]|jgi:serine/threonine protein kinase